MPNEYTFLVNALCDIQEECSKHDICAECPLHDPENHVQCSLINSLPYRWNVNEMIKVVK